MKKLLVLLLLCGSCFAASECVKPNIRVAWDALYAGNRYLAINILSIYIDDFTISPMDKIHYLNTRSVMYALMGDKENHDRDCDYICSLCTISIECVDEFMKVEDHLYMYHHLIIPPNTCENAHN